MYFWKIIKASYVSYVKNIKQHSLLKRNTKNFTKVEPLKYKILKINFIPIYWLYCNWILWRLRMLQKVKAWKSVSLLKGYTCTIHIKKLHNCICGLKYQKITLYSWSSCTFCQTLLRLFHKTSIIACVRILLNK